ncbi:unnamed protein product, partial [Iphiclides podalirius]
MPAPEESEERMRRLRSNAIDAWEQRLEHPTPLLSAPRYCRIDVPLVLGPGCGSSSGESGGSSWTCIAAGGVAALSIGCAGVGPRLGIFSSRSESSGEVRGIALFGGRGYNGVVVMSLACNRADSSAAVATRSAWR